MKRWELAGRLLLVLTLVGTPIAIVSYQRSLAQQPHLYTIVAHTAESGGFVPHEIIAMQGEHARLRLTSADVTHGFNCPGLGIYVPELYPGKYVTVDFTPRKPGRYLFVCTVLCSPEHGDMQGTIVVQPGKQMTGRDGRGGGIGSCGTPRRGRSQSVGILPGSGYRPIDTR